MLFADSLLHVPPAAGPLPGVVLLHGSGGGGARYDAVASRLAKQGYAVLAYTYFRPPACLERIDLDRIEQAIDWLRESPCVAGLPVALVGVSRGAELALLLASRIRTTARVAAVAVHAPCDVICRAWDPNAKSGLASPAWVSATRPEGLAPRTRIPIEDYEGPLFVTHGTADEVWSDRYSRDIEATRLAAGRHVEAHFFEGEGHGFSAEGYARMVALRETFLETHLRPQ